MNRHERYFSFLETIAEDMEPYSGARVVACLVFNREIVSFGFCQHKTHTRQARYSKNRKAIHLHAEIDCINKAIRKMPIRNLRKSTLYILRLKKEDRWAEDMVWALAKPCSGCSRAIAAFGIKEIYYTEEKGIYRNEVF